MALFDRCKSLRDRIAGHESLRRAHKQAEAVSNRANELVKVQRELSADMRRVKVLRAKGLEVPPLPSPAAALAARDDYAEELKGSFSEGGNYRRLMRSLDRVARDLREAVTKALATVKRDLPTIDDGFLNLVALIPAHSEQVARIRNARDALFARADLASMSPEELKTFLDQLEDLRKDADSLSPTEFPKEVLDFFKAVRHRDGAPLEKLTETVRAWLEERDQLRNVRVRFLLR
jgi:hypothetical protein